MIKQKFWKWAFLIRHRTHISIYSLCVYEWLLLSYYIFILFFFFDQFIYILPFVLFSEINVNLCHSVCRFILPMNDFSSFILLLLLLFSFSFFLFLYFALLKHCLLCFLFQNLYIIYSLCSLSLTSIGMSAKCFLNIIFFICHFSRI